MPSPVEDLERKVQSLRDQLKQAEESLYKARLAELRLVPDKTVILDKAGNEYLFTSARQFWKGHLPWASGKKKLKSGAWGEHSKNLYSDWSIKP